MKPRCQAIFDVEVPSVFVGHLPEGGVDNVKADDFGGSYRMGHHLARQGHQCVAHITGPSDFPAAVLRREGFRQGLLDGGVPEDRQVIFEGTYLSPSGMTGIAWLTEHARRRPTAVFFSNYLMAVGGLAALFDRGLRVPQDIAVGVFGNHPPMFYMRPKLTHVGVPPARLSARACAMLLDRLDGRYSGAPQVDVLECEFVDQGSA